MNRPQKSPEAGRRPHNGLLFGAGLTITVLALACLALSAFVDSRVFDVLTSGLVPGSLMIVYGWRGPDPGQR